jgi:hypothetical protein
MACDAHQQHAVTVQVGHARESSSQGLSRRLVFNNNRRLEQESKRPDGELVIHAVDVVQGCDECLSLLYSPDLSQTQSAPGSQPLNSSFGVQAETP